jgi:16S rRNA processing protein RimM
LPQPRILLGVIGRPHGVRGLLHVVSHTQNPAALAEYGPLDDGAGRSFVLRWRGPGNDGGVAAVAEVVDGREVPVTDRDAAARLTNTRLYIDRDRLPAPDEEEFYLADLLGLSVQDAAGVLLGKVAQVHDYGAGVSLEIARADAPALLVPFTRASVPVVDVASGRITVVPPEEIEAAPRAEAAE